jgi:hypothetical protein
MGDCILDYTEKKMNKINGQADDAPRDSKKSGERKSEREDCGPKYSSGVHITDEMISACARVLRESGLLRPGADPKALSLAWDCLVAVRDSFESH